MSRRRWPRVQTCTRRQHVRLFFYGLNFVRQLLIQTQQLQNRLGGFDAFVSDATAASLDSLVHCVASQNPERDRQTAVDCQVHRTADSG